MSRKIVMTLVCILVLGLSGCGDTLTLNQYNAEWLEEIFKQE